MSSNINCYSLLFNQNGTFIPRSRSFEVPVPYGSNSYQNQYNATSHSPSSNEVNRVNGSTKFVWDKETRSHKMVTNTY